MTRVADLLEASLVLHHQALQLRSKGKSREAREVLTQSAAKRIRAITLDTAMSDEAWQSQVKGMSGRGVKTHAEIHSHMLAHYHAQGCHVAGREQAEREERMERGERERG